MLLLQLFYLLLQSAYSLTILLFLIVEALSLLLKLLFQSLYGFP